MDEQPASFTAGAHASDERELMRQLSSSPLGLTASGAAAASQKYGPNAWSVEQKDTPLKILVRQLSNPLMLMLVAAAFVSYLIGHNLDALGILAAVVLSVFFGFFQEYKAEQALSALKKMTAPRAIVLREGREREIPAEEVAVGDILILSEGMLVPADARVLPGASLTADQSLLTGESHPSAKQAEALPRATALAERSNMVYAGTQIVRGHGRALAVATGLSTEFGRIAATLAQTQSEPTPLQKQLGELGSKVGQASVALAILFFILGLLRGQPWADMLVVAVSLAVAAIPEGLPTVLAMTMAIGVQRMAAHHALVRKLPAVETLGSATVICTDKTGTLTANQMTLTRLFVDGADYEFKGGPQALSAAIVRASGNAESAPSASAPAALAASDRKKLEAALSAYALCNDAALIR
ncbi:MAG: HAD-IC family P-type ATPase, partial [Candidatus Micrarchaeota archaeon]|nr:HAD-IC family P-type ATPase [Candidatus Micrarchaeota archaeon]